MVAAYRLTHPVAANRPVHWQEGPASPAAGQRPPNIILIVADAIAHQGADFTTAYSANATCSPSRAALMTGRYPQRFGFEFTAVPDQLAKYVPRYSPKNRPYPTIYHADRQSEAPAMEDMGMPSSEITIAELLRQRGYYTIHIEIGRAHV